MLKFLVTLLAFSAISASLFISDCFGETSWISIGPYGGSTSSLAITPADGQTLYVGTNGGSLFKTVNGGASYSLSGNGMPSDVRVLSLAVDPENNRTMYAGTWDNGIYKSTDGGASWGAAADGLAVGRVTGIEIDVVDNQIVYALVEGCGMYKSTDGAIGWTPINNGITGGSVKAFVIDPSNHMILRATGYVNGYSNDGGVSWSEVNNEILCTALAIDPTDSLTIYIGTENSGIFKSIDGGMSWDQIANGFITEYTYGGVLNYPNIVNAIRIDRKNARTLYAGTSIGGVFKTADGGLSWSQSNNGLIGTGVSSIVIDPADSRTLYAGTITDGVFKSIDGGALWRAANTGMSNATIGPISINPSDSQELYARADFGAAYSVFDPVNSKILKTTSGGGMWSAIDNIPQGTYLYSVTYDPTNSQILYGTVSIPTPYYTTDYGVIKSYDGGMTWSPADNGLSGSNGGIHALVVNRFDNKTVFSGADGGVFKTKDGGVNWFAANGGMSWDVLSLAIDPADGRTLYAGTYGQGIFKSTDEGITWVALNSGAISPANVSRIVIDPVNSRIIYATDWTDGIFKTTDGGANWAKINAGLPSTQNGVGAELFDVADISIDPANSNILFAGTPEGLFRSTNAGAVWLPYGLTGKSVTSIVVDPVSYRTIYAGTAKEGIFKTTGNNAPFMTAPDNLTFVEGKSGDQKLTASGWPAPDFSLMGNLPAGLTFNASTGVIGGMPVIGTSGDYPLLVTASNGVPPDAVRGITVTVLPSSDLSAEITSPVKGSGLAALTSIAGSAAGAGLAIVELMVSDGSYYLQSDGGFAVTPSWISVAPESGNWALNTTSVIWREGITYTVTVRASDGTKTSVSVTSNFTIQMPQTKVGTILTISATPDKLRTGDTAVLTGALVRSDSSAVSGQTVTFLITPPATAEVPRPVPSVITATTDTIGAFTASVADNFTRPGVYLVQARFEGGSVLAASFASLTIGVTPQSGYAIIVTGKASDNTLLAEHTATTDTIYSTLVNKRGFLPGNINYLKNNVSRQQIREAITVWAKNKLATVPGHLYLIMIDHGSASGFVLGSDVLAPDGTDTDNLKSYLNTLENDPGVISSGAIANYNRIIMIGSCYSGSFATRLSKPGRIVLSSATATEQSIAGFTIYNSVNSSTINGGEYFFDSLFSYLGRGDTLKDAFNQSISMVELRDPRKMAPGFHAGVYDTLAQHPLLDDNGDGSPSYVLDADGMLAANLRLGVGIRSPGNPADIIAVTETAIIPPRQAADTLLWLKVNDNSRIARAWMEIRTPVSTADTSATGQAIPRLVTLPLYYDGLQWNGSYSFPKEGRYNILYYTQDNLTGDIAPAKNSVVYRQLTGNSLPVNFSLLSPEADEAVSGIFTLTWDKVAVPSPNRITYTLRVFGPDSTEVYKEENIPQNATYMPRDALKNPGTGAYYCNFSADTYCTWRVTAIDGYGASADSNTGSFTIVSTNAMPVMVKGYVRDLQTGEPIENAACSASDGTSTVYASSLSTGLCLMPLPQLPATVTVAASNYVTRSNISIPNPDNNVSVMTVSLNPAHRTLTININGDGTVTGENVSCTSSCSKEINYGDIVNLHHTDTPVFAFASWSGDCSGTDCQLTMTIPRTVTANFIAAPKAMVNSTGYESLNLAYGAIPQSGTATIYLLGIDLAEALTVDSGKNVKLDGGYSAVYAKGLNPTYLKAPLRVISGSLRVDGVKVR